MKQFSNKKCFLLHDFAKNNFLLQLKLYVNIIQLIALRPAVGTTVYPPTIGSQLKDL